MLRHHLGDIDFRQRPATAGPAYRQKRMRAGSGLFTDSGTPQCHQSGSSLTGLMRYLSPVSCAQGWVDDQAAFPIAGRPRPRPRFGWAATAPELEGVGGLYSRTAARRRRGSRPCRGWHHDYACSVDNAQRLWQLSSNGLRRDEFNARHQRLTPPDQLAVSNASLPTAAGRGAHSRAAAVVIRCHCWCRKYRKPPFPHSGGAATFITPPVRCRALHRRPRHRTLELGGLAEYVVLPEANAYAIPMCAAFSAANALIQPQPVLRCPGRTCST
jgi:hypothetical protein